jgi:5-formyltetrahydrofolate cyclo-ligase
MLKQELIKIMLEIRKEYTPRYKHIRNQQIMLNLFQQFNFNLLKTIHIYFSNETNQLVDSKCIIRNLLSSFSHINIILPTLNYEYNCLLHKKYTARTTLHKNEILGLLEPITNKIMLNTNLIDMVIVPVLAFDNKGYKISYANEEYENHYNNFLKTFYGIKIGLCFETIIEPPITDKTPHIMLDYCITPNKVYNFINNTIYVVPIEKSIIELTLPQDEVHNHYISLSGSHKN